MSDHPIDKCLTELPSHTITSPVMLPPLPKSSPAPVLPRAKVSHVLKTVEPFFDDVWEGRKTFEIRRDDRGFCVDNLLELCEYHPGTDSYSGRVIVAEVTYKISHDQFPDGMQPGYCCLGIKVKYRLHR